MLPVPLPVPHVDLRQLLRPDDEEVLRAPLFGRLREVERPRDDRLSVDDHDLVVGDGMCAVDVHRDPVVSEKGGAAVFLRSLALIEDDLHRHAPLVGIDEGLGDGCRGERVGLNADFESCVVDLSHDRLRRPAIRGEVHTGGDIAKGRVDGVAYGRDRQSNQDGKGNEAFLHGVSSHFPENGVSGKAIQGDRPLTDARSRIRPGAGSSAR